MEIKGFAQLLEQILDPPVSYQRVAKIISIQKTLTPKFAKNVEVNVAKDVDAILAQMTFKKSLLSI